MNRKELNERVKEELDKPMHPCSLKKAGRSVDAVLKILGDAIVQEERIEIPELGVFEHKHGYGQSRKVPGSTVVENYDPYWYVKFKPIKRIRETVRSKDGSTRKKKVFIDPDQITLNFS